MVCFVCDAKMRTFFKLAAHVNSDLWALFAREISYTTYLKHDIHLLQCACEQNTTV